MRKLISLAAQAALIAVTLGAAGMAHAVPVAATWEDDIVFNGGSGIYLSEGIWWLGIPNDSHSYNHNINSDGFVVGSDLVLDYDLTLGFGDDNRSDSGEWAYINLPGLLADEIVEIDYQNESLGVSLTGLAQLNLSGLLTVTIEAIDGDFYLKNSSLIARGLEFRAVPEPSILMLLGAGLAGVGLARRRRRA